MLVPISRMTGNDGPTTKPNRPAKVAFTTKLFTCQMMIWNMTPKTRGLW